MSARVGAGKRAFAATDVRSSGSDAPAAADVVIASVANAAIAPWRMGGSSWHAAGCQGFLRALGSGMKRSDATWGVPVGARHRRGGGDRVAPVSGRPSRRAVDRGDPGDARPSPRGRARLLHVPRP